MPRVDVWDVPPASDVPAPLSCGFQRDPKFVDAYNLGKQLGAGGFGSVHVAHCKRTGRDLACKSIRKRLAQVGSALVPPAKQQQHLDNIIKEVTILRKLRGTLNVVHLEEVFEDDESVHMVMEWCRGGELLHAIGKKHYSERTVASYMRAVLRTLAQCHSLNILHRDVKPGNFMLLSEDSKAPLKAIDFGLAVFFDPAKLPRSDLGLEGTPWYMAPEVLSNAVGPPADVWAAGVMTFQLLSGRFPYDDRKNPSNPALSLVWRSILTDEADFNKPYWADISADAKAFVRELLNKDPAKRPSAKQALAHPWLQGRSDQRSQGKPLATTVVQRLQRYSVQNAFKRTVLDLIANELLQQHIEASAAAASRAPQQGADANSTVVEADDEGTFGRVVAAAADVLDPEAADKDAAEDTAVHQAEVGSSTINSRLRQMAAEDLLRSLARRHHTVHSGFEAFDHLSRQRKLELQGSDSQNLTAAPEPTQPAQPMATRVVAAVRPTAPVAILRGQSAAQSERIAFPGSLDAHLGGRVLGAINQHKPRATSALSADLDSPPDSDSKPRIGPGRQAFPGVSLPAMPISIPGRSLGAQLDSPNASDRFGVVSPSPGRGSALLSMDSAASDGMPVYRGPVRDAAAASARDLQYLARRKTGLLSMDGSGHALQQYARLLGVTERSLHGGTAAVEEGASVPPPQSPDAIGASQLSSPPGVFALLSGSPHDGVRPSGKGLKRGVSMGGIAQHGTAPLAPSGEYVRMLEALQKQRVEARKAQRLGLDTSGRGGNKYAQFAQGVPEEDLDMQEDAAAEAAAVSERGMSAAQDVEDVRPSQNLDPTKIAATQAAQTSGSRPGGASVAAKVRDSWMSPLTRMFGTSNSPRTSGSGAGSQAVGLGIGASTSSSAPLGMGARQAGSVSTGAAAAATRNASKAAERQPAAKAVLPLDSNIGVLSPRKMEVVREEEGGRGQRGYASYLQRRSLEVPHERAVPPNKQPVDTGTTTTSAHAPDAPAAAVKPPGSNASAGGSTPPASASGDAAGTGISVPLDGLLRKLVAGPEELEEFQRVLGRLQYGQHEALSYSQVSEGLHHLGYRLQPSEVAVLLNQVTLNNTASTDGAGITTGASDSRALTPTTSNVADHMPPASLEARNSEFQGAASLLDWPSEPPAASDGSLTASQFLASQVDWRQFQANHRDEWLQCLRKTFAAIGGQDGRLSVDDLVKLLSDKLPAAEVNSAVQETLADAAAVDSGGLAFEDFVRLVRSSSTDSLQSDASYDLYDPRYSTSVHGGHMYGGAGEASGLETVPDVEESREG